MYSTWLDHVASESEKMNKQRKQMFIYVSLCEEVNKIDKKKNTDNTYSHFTWSLRMIHLLSTKSATLIETDEKFIMITTSAIDINTIWIMNVAWAVD